MHPLARKGGRLAAVALVLIAVIEVGVLAWVMAPVGGLVWWISPWLVGFSALFLGLAVSVWLRWRHADVVAMGITGAWAIIVVASVASRWVALAAPGAEAVRARELSAAAAMVILAVFVLVRLGRRR